MVHLFVKPAGSVNLLAIHDAVAQLDQEGGQVVTAAILGHKADACVMALAEDAWALRRLQSALEYAGLEVVESFVSLTEISEYGGGAPDAIKQARLYPNLPPAELRAFCFYPMSKRRGDKHNWYSLEFDERKALMTAHGKSGRNFHGRILQVVTGATGLDDWEWGVTLFGRHSDDLKDCVYTMRFDEASTLYAEFGPFYTGVVGSIDEVFGSLAL